MGAPVCNINTKNPAPISLAPALPSIPVATDLQSLIAAVNALRQLTIQYFNQVPGNSNTGFNGTPGQPGTIGAPGAPGTVGGGGGGFSPVGSFAETPGSRTTVTTRIYDPNDPTNETYVDVKQITGLTFANKTGQTIVWSQGS